MILSSVHTFCCNCYIIFFLISEKFKEKILLWSRTYTGILFCPKYSGQGIDILYCFSFLICKMLVIESIPQRV